MLPDALQDAFFERELGGDVKLAIDREIAERGITDILEARRDRIAQGKRHSLSRVIRHVLGYAGGVRGWFLLNRRQRYRVMLLVHRVVDFMDDTLPNHIGVGQVAQCGRSAMLALYDVAIERSRGFGKQAMLATRALRNERCHEWFIFPGGRPVPAWLADRQDEYIEHPYHDWRRAEE